MFKKISAVFARREYRRDKGNLFYSHLMVHLDWSQISRKETTFMNDLIRAFTGDMVRSNKVKWYIRKVFFLMCMIFTKYIKKLKNTFDTDKMRDALQKKLMIKFDAGKLIMYL